MSWLMTLPKRAAPIVTSTAGVANGNSPIGGPMSIIYKCSKGQLCSKSFCCPECEALKKMVEIKEKRNNYGPERET